MTIVQPPPRSLEELLTHRRYFVPLFQRPFEWKEDPNLLQLWEDIETNEPPYFLGTILLKPRPRNGKSNSYEFEVIDGQQRLASLLLLIRSAVEVLEAGDDDWSKKKAQDFQSGYIDQKRPAEDEPKLTLTLSKRDRDFFRSLLTTSREVGTPMRTAKSKSQPKSHKLLSAAKEFFLKKVRQIKQEHSSTAVRDFLDQKILTLQFLEMHLQNESDAYLFFETLNDRGMDLSTADLIKNAVCRKAEQENASPEEAASVIDNDIAGVLGDGKLRQFFLHFCWANAESESPPSRKKLMPWYNERIEGSRSVKRDFLDELKLFADSYKDFVDPVRCTDKDEKMPLTFLRALGATRCYPLLMQARHQLKKKDFLRIACALEVLTFRHSTVLKWDAKELESVYYELAQTLRREKKVEPVLESLRRQRALKQEFDPQFKQAFELLEPENTLVAKYILLKLEEALGTKQERLDWDDLTVEHILARELDWERKEDFLDRLGNLALWSGRFNSSARNKPFKDKKQLYSESKLNLTRQLAEYDDFDYKAIEERQKKLGNHILQIWTATRII